MSYQYDYPRPCVTADILLFRNPQKPEILLIRRMKSPFKGQWAIPGGFIDMDETLEQAAHRELEEETGVKNVHLEQLHAFSAIHRDPRHRTITIAFWGIIPEDKPLPLSRAGSDAAETAWFPLDSLPELAFDHADIIGFAREKLTGNGILRG